MKLDQDIVLVVYSVNVTAQVFETELLEVQLDRLSDEFRNLTPTARKVLLANIIALRLSVVPFRLWTR